MMFTYKEEVESDEGIVLKEKRLELELVKMAMNSYFSEHIGESLDTVNIKRYLSKLFAFDINVKQIEKKECAFQLSMQDGTDIITLDVEVSHTSLV